MKEPYLHAGRPGGSRLRGLSRRQPLPGVLPRPTQCVLTGASAGTPATSGTSPPPVAPQMPAVHARNLRVVPVNLSLITAED